MDKPIKGRFCWRAQGRVRANPPFPAPRISPVFAASVFSCLAVRVRNPLPAASLSLETRSLPFGASVASRRTQPWGERISSLVDEVGSPGQFPLFRGERSNGLTESWRDGAQDTAAARPDVFSNSSLRFSRKCGVAPGFSSAADADEPSDSSPDWRVLGEQDLRAGEFPA